MPRQVSTARTDPKCTSAIPMQEEMHYSSTVADPAPHLDLFRQDIDNRFEIGKVQELTLSVPGIAKVSSWDCHSEPITPTLLSPTSPASSSTSSHDIGFTWDSPQTPQTPSRQKGHVNMDPATPLTPPEPLEDTLNDQVLVAELAYGTPSRTDCDDDEGNLKKHTQSSEIFQSGIRNFRPMIESFTRDAALYQDGHDHQPLNDSLSSKIAPQDKDGNESESMFTAIARGSEMIASGLEATEVKHGATTCGTTCPTQPPSALNFDIAGLPTQTISAFPSVHDITFAKGIPQSFAFGVDNVAQQKHKPRVTTPQIKTETTPKAFLEIPYQCRGKRKLLEQILPFEINTRLVDDSNMCVATQVKEMKRCQTARRSRLNAVDITVDAIRDCVSRRDYSSLPQHIECLIQDVMCPLHQTIALRRNTKSPRMDALRDLIDGFPRTHAKMVPIFENWLQGIIKIANPESLQVANPAIPSPLPSSKWTPYHAKQSNDCEITRALTARASEPLTEADRKHGFIYMFWDQQTFGMIKVGRAVDLEQRLKQWNAQCKMAHYYHQYSQDGEPSKIPHCQRIEKLLHTELSNYRKKRICDGCGRTHIEWFDISAERAKKVYRKWQDWIMQEPYAQDDTGRWTLRPDMVETLREVCKPVVFSDPIVPTRPRRSLQGAQVKQRTSRTLI